MSKITSIESAAVSALGEFAQVVCANRLTWETDGMSVDYYMGRLNLLHNGKILRSVELDDDASELFFQIWTIVTR